MPTNYFLGPKPVLVLNHIDVVLEALVTKMNDFAGRPKIYTGTPFHFCVGFVQPVIYNIYVNFVIIYIYIEQNVQIPLRVQLKHFYKIQNCVF